ncbi:MAG: zinc-ribbon domain-containing protein [Exilibacterium sp.]
MADMVTRCPQCGTSFRITQAQVQTAKGAVRCGSCLQIFKALDNLSEPRQPGTDKQQGQVEKSTLQKAAATHPASHKNSPQRTEKQQAVVQRTDIKSPSPDARAATGSGSSDDRLLAKPTKVTNIAQPKATGAPSTNKPAHPPTKERLDFDQAAIDSESEMLISDDMYDKDLDDDDLLISDDMDDVQDSNEVNSAYKKSDSSSSVFSDSFLKLDHWQSEQKTLFDREIKVNDSEEKDTADESWAVSLLEELEEEEAAATEKASQIKPESDDNNEPPDELKDEDPEENFATFDDKNTSITADDEKANVAAFNTKENLEEFEHDKAEFYTRGTDRHPLLTSIEPAPVEMHARRDRLKRSWLSRRQRPPEKKLALAASDSDYSAGVGYADSHFSIRSF